MENKINTFVDLSLSDYLYSIKVYYEKIFIKKHKILGISVKYFGKRTFKYEPTPKNICQFEGYNGRSIIWTGPREYLGVTLDAVKEEFKKNNPEDYKINGWKKMIEQYKINEKKDSCQIKYFCTGSYRCNAKIELENERCKFQAYDYHCQNKEVIKINLEQELDKITRIKK